MLKDATLNEVLRDARVRRLELDDRKVELCLNQAELAAEILSVDKLIEMLEAIRLEYAIHVEEDPSMVERLSRLRKQS